MADEMNERTAASEKTTAQNMTLTTCKLSGIYEYLAHDRKEKKATTSHEHTFWYVCVRAQMSKSKQIERFYLLFQFANANKSPSTPNMARKVGI